MSQYFRKVLKEGVFSISDVFVEVKKRNTPNFGDPFNAINARKRQHLIKCAMFYLKSHNSFNRKTRFDVVGIEGEQVKIIKNAFMVEE